MEQEDDAEEHFVGHGPCEACGSSDACARYSSGSTHCFSCGKHSRGGGGNTVVKRLKRRASASSSMLQVEYRAIVKRKLTLETCSKWGYGVAKVNGKLARTLEVAEGSYVHVAQYSKDGVDVTAQKLRTADKGFHILGNSRSLGLYGKHLWRDKGRRLVITEGELDALSWSQMQGNKWPVVSIPHGADSAAKAVKKDLDFVEGYDSVILMLDADEPGRKAAEDIAALLTPGKAHIVTMPRGIKDASDALQQGRTAELVSAFWDAKVYRPDGIMAASDVIIKMRDEARATVIADPPFAGLKSMTGRLVAGTLWTVTSGSGMGKTEFMREFAVGLLKAGLKVGHIGLEESVTRTLTGYVGMFMGKRLDLCDEVNEAGEVVPACDLPGFKKACEEADLENKLVLYDDWGSVDSKHLLSKMRYMRISQDCDVIILDHLSIIVSDLEEDDERKTIDKIMTRLRTFAEETGCLLILASHLKRPEGKPHEEGGRTTLAQLRGSAAIGQLSDIVIGLERDQQATDGTEDVTIMRILKNRRTGMTGVAGYVEYDRETGRFNELTDNPFDEEETKQVTQF